MDTDEFFRPKNVEPAVKLLLMQGSGETVGACEKNRESYDLQVGCCIVKRSREIVFAKQGEYKYKHTKAIRQTIQESKKMTLVYGYPAQSLLTVNKDRDA